MAETDKPSDSELSELNQGLIQEEFPYPKTTSNEEILNTNRNHNAWIIIGRDKPAGLESGFGQYTKKNYGDKSTTIDVCVGRYSSDAGKEGYLRTDVVGNNFQKDASRIYISQKTNVDTNFQIEKAGTLVPAMSKAAIAIKSDNLRFIGRESVKIVADCGDLNSLGNRESSVYPKYGIQLICGSETKIEDVQGIVKSGNLHDCLNEIVTMIDDCFNALYNFIQTQREFNEAVANHRHLGHFNPSPAGSVNIFPSVTLMARKEKFVGNTENMVLPTISSNRVERINLINTSYLSPANAKTYIGSIYNRTN